jgi:hypothetical protein
MQIWQKVVCHRKRNKHHINILRRINNYIAQAILWKWKENHKLPYSITTLQPNKKYKRLENCGNMHWICVRLTPRTDDSPTTTSPIKNEREISDSLAEDYFENLHNCSHHFLFLKKQTACNSLDKHSLKVFCNPIKNRNLVQ